jgi:hypothetical protein
VEFITVWHATNMVAKRNERKKSKVPIHKYKRCGHNDGARGRGKRRVVKKENTKENGGFTFEKLPF